MSFLLRLKERKVVQWGLTYLAGAWALLQVVDLVGEQFGWPGVLLRSVTILLAVGLPAALILAWYHGEKGQQRIAGIELLMLTTLLVLAGVAVAWVRGDRGAAAEPLARATVDSPFVSAAAAPHAIAVLPFTNLSDSKENEYFSDGITEDIMRNLSRIGELRVISRTSAMTYRDTDKPLPEIARELGVAYIVEGSVRRADRRVRISAQLIHARTDQHVWADIYDRDLEDVFAIQSEVAEKIAAALRTNLSPEERQRLHARGTEDLPAYDFYLKGRYLWNRRTEPDLLKAIANFEAAIALDSAYALAYAGLSHAYSLLPEYGRVPPRDAYLKAGAAARRALQLDSTLADAHLASAHLAEREGRRGAAEAKYIRALALDPNDATGRHWYALFLAWTGRMHEAVAEIRRAQALDPVSRVIGTTHAAILYWDGKYDQAIEIYTRTLEFDPNFAPARWWIAMAYLRTGRQGEALVELQRAVELSDRSPAALTGLAYAYAVAGRRAEAGRILRDLQALPRGSFVSPARIALVYVGLGDRREAVDWLEKAEAERDPWLELVLMDPALRSLRAEPRVHRLVSRLGMRLPS